MPNFFLPLQNWPCFPIPLKVYDTWQDTHTSRTTSGSMSVRSSSSFSSLQQTPPALELRAHFEGKGVGCRDDASSKGQTGGFVFIVDLGGSGTAATGAAFPLFEAIFVKGGKTGRRGGWW